MAERVPVGLAGASKGRKFGLTIGLAFSALAGLLVWRAHVPLAVGAGVLGGALLLAALVAPTALVPVERGWMAFAHAVSKVTTPIVMGVVYFIVVAPIGVLMRLVGHHPLRHGAEGSRWVSRSAEGAGRGGMTRQF